MHRVNLLRIKLVILIFSLTTVAGNRQIEIHVVNLVTAAT